MLSLGCCVSLSKAEASQQNQSAAVQAGNTMSLKKQNLLQALTCSQGQVGEMCTLYKVTILSLVCRIKKNGITKVMEAMRPAVPEDSDLVLIAEPCI